MCGIMGVVTDGERIDPVAFAHALQRLEHRGPDGEGTWRRSEPGAPAVMLGHRRLAVIDRSAAGAQPMSSVAGHLWITYNGEIYNYVELRDELAADGYRFRSQSDTEVLLAAYERWGSGCLARLNGMFAFAIWDERARQLFAARDRFGEKPFHYAWDRQRGTFAFASEIKALLAIGAADAGVDERALHRFLAFQELAGSEQTLWRGIKRLPAAHWLSVDCSGPAPVVRTERYWDIDLERTAAIAFGEAAHRFAELFEDSVRLRLRSDVPVGTSLSGGLDSSAVVCQVHALGAAGGQKAFSARMSDPALDEGLYISAVLSKTGVEGHDVWPSAEDLTRVFPRLCYHLEEPFLSTSQFAQFLVMNLAHRERVTVLLDGQGADEMLAGYPPYYLARYGDLARDWRVAELAAEWRGFRHRHHRPFPLSLKSVVAGMFPGVHRGSGGQEPVTPPAWQRVWNPDWLASFRDEAPAQAPASPRDGLTRKLYHDMMSGPLQELLRFGDRNSMAWSRELRQPFLDHRLAEYVFALPPHYKLHRGETKVVMRAAMERLLPRRIASRQDKLGYQAPMDSWMAGPAARWTEQQLERTVAAMADRVAPDFLARIGAAGGPLAALGGRLTFSLLTLGETYEQLRAMSPTAAAA